MISEFSQMIHCMVLENPIPARDLAKAVGKPYSTLLRELNPYDSGAKLGVETYFQLLEKTGDLSSLEYMLRRFGLCLAPLETPLAAACRRRFNRGSSLSVPGTTEEVPEKKHQEEDALA